MVVWKFQWIVLLALTISASAHSLTAEEQLALNQTIDKIEIEEVSTEILSQEKLYNYNLKFSSSAIAVDPLTVIDPGKIIGMGKDLVALGESVYSLVQHGKPTNVTKYAPISVIPKIGTEPVDIFETESWSMPVKRTFVVNFINVYRIKVVKFRYSVLFSYGGTYNGKGAYLTAAQIIPESVDTLFGFDFTATMKLGGVQNQGKRTNPIAGATLLMEYSANSVMKAITRVDTFFITGKGGFKRY
jgi:hypothetical protein